MSVLRNSGRRLYKPALALLRLIPGGFGCGLTLGNDLDPVLVPGGGVFALMVLVPGGGVFALTVLVPGGGVFALTVLVPGGGVFALAFSAALIFAAAAA